MKDKYKKVVIYKVNNQFLDYTNDPEAVEIMRVRNWIEARNEISKLMESDNIPLNPSGYKQSLYQYCNVDEWEGRQLTFLK